MKIVGIIAEYNPFHTGHAYHIARAKELSGADYAVVVLSPDFVQRGEPAIFDKYTRTEMALYGGADLVIQLPVCYASGSAEYFAEGAVSLLHSLGITDTLCFGAESADPDLFRLTADVLCSDPKSYTDHLRLLLKHGFTFPQARSQALSEYFTEHICDSGYRAAIPEFLASPNNILGIEYCKALQKCGSSIQPLPITRIGNEYNSSEFGTLFSSATSIRKAMLSKSDTDKMYAYIPEDCRELFRKSLNACVISDDFLFLLYQKLLQSEHFSDIFDITKDLSDRISSMRYKCIGRNMQEITALLKTRQITESRIRRALLHLLLNLQEDAISDYRQNGTVFYARILGFRKTSAAILHELKIHAQIPILSKPAAAESVIRDFHSEHESSADAVRCALDMWKQDIDAAHLYQTILAAKYKLPFKTEYEYSPIIR